MASNAEPEVVNLWRRTTTIRHYKFYGIVGATLLRFTQKVIGTNEGSIDEARVFQKLKKRGASNRHLTFVPINGAPQARGSV